MDRLQASWNSSYATVKQILSDTNRVSGALKIEATLTHNHYSTHATPQQVIDVLKSSELIVSIDAGAAFSIDATPSAPATLVVDTALIRYACDYLMPHETFDDLYRSAREISAAGAGKMSATVKILRTETSRVANAFLIQSIRYEALKIFVLAHEATHLSFDRFSPDLMPDSLRAQGVRGELDCITAFYTETRADIVAENAVRSLPIVSISEEVRTRSPQYPESLLASLSELATRSALKDQLTIIENTKEWLNYSSCQFSPGQRRLQLETALNREDAKMQMPK
jgi:hypothetical protein